MISIELRRRQLCDRWCDQQKYTLFTYSVLLFWCVERNIVDLGSKISWNVNFFAPKMAVRMKCSQRWGGNSLVWQQKLPENSRTTTSNFSGTHTHTQSTEISALRSKYLTNNKANSQFMFGMHDFFAYCHCYCCCFYSVVFFSSLASAPVRASKRIPLFTFIYIFIPFTLADICVVYLYYWCCWCCRSSSRCYSRFSYFSALLCIVFLVQIATACDSFFLHAHPDRFCRSTLLFKWKGATFQNDVRASALDICTFWLRFHFWTSENSLLLLPPSPPTTTFYSTWHFCKENSASDSHSNRICFGKRIAHLFSDGFGFHFFFFSSDAFSALFEHHSISYYIFYVWKHLIGPIRIIIIIFVAAFRHFTEWKRRQMKVICAILWP